MQNVDVIVAGAGHNGLVSACYLAKAGLKVLVLEAHQTPGGMTCTNPMAPEAPEHIINEASIHASMFRMSPINDELELEKKFGLRQRLIDPCHYQLCSDGDASFGMWRDPNRTAKEISHFSKRDAQAWLKMSETIDAALRIGLPLAMENPTKPSFESMFKVLTKAVGNFKHLGPIAKLMTGTHAGTLEELFETDIVRAGLLTGLPFMDFRADHSSFAMVYLGVLQKYGVTMFEGGTGGFPAALIRCLEAYGGSVRCSAKVKQMLVENERVVGVVLEDGEEVRAKKGVVTAFSPKMVLNHMLPEGLLDHPTQVKAKFIPTSNRGIADYKLNIALKGKITPTRSAAWRKAQGWEGNMRLGTLQWSTYEDGRKAYTDCIRGLVPDVIAGLSQITTEFDPSMAPPGHDTFWFWSGLIPFEPHIGWDKAREQITNTLVADASRIYDGIEEFEIARRPLCPPDIEKRFHAIDGSVYHCDPYITRFAHNRPAKGLAGYKIPVQGLYLSGSGTHPSAGICGLPGRNAAITLLKHSR